MALTDQAITKIKDLIVKGEFAPGARLPKEQELAERLGLSRNSLREAVRALSLVGVLEARQGDGTYVTSLEPELLLAGTSFLSDLLAGPTLRELFEVRRILEPVATALATPRLDDEDFAALAESLERMDTADTIQAFIDADVDFHRVIVNACGNATLASLIQNLSGGTAGRGSGGRSTSVVPWRARVVCTTTSSARCGCATRGLPRRPTSSTWLPANGGSRRSARTGRAPARPVPSAPGRLAAELPRSPSSRAPCRCRRSLRPPALDDRSTASATPR